MPSKRCGGRWLDGAADALATTLGAFVPARRDAPAPAAVDAGCGGGSDGRGRTAVGRGEAICTALTASACAPCSLPSAQGAGGSARTKDCGDSLRCTASGPRGPWMMNHESTGRVTGTAGTWRSHARCNSAESTSAGQSRPKLPLTGPSYTKSDTKPAVTVGGGCMRMCRASASHCGAHRFFPAPCNPILTLAGQHDTMPTETT